MCIRLSFHRSGTCLSLLSFLSRFTFSSGVSSLAYIGRGCSYQIIFYVSFSFIFLEIIWQHVHACRWSHSSRIIRNIVKSYSGCWKMVVESLGTIHSHASHIAPCPPPPPPLSTIFLFSFFLFVPPHIAFNLHFSFITLIFFKKKKKNFFTNSSTCTQSLRIKIGRSSGFWPPEWPACYAPIVQRDGLGLESIGHRAFFEDGLCYGVGAIASGG